MASVAFHTLGCKVNQYETRRIADGFAEAGFQEVAFSEPADVCVINSCTVTLTADAKSRQAARSALSRNPEAFVVLTGCYAEVSPGEARRVAGVSMVVGNSAKAGLAALVIERLPRELRASLVAGQAVPRPRGRTRATVKIQDGCDQFCSYCAVPLARPVMSCQPFDEVMSEVASLAAGGYREVVLTGIRLGRYRDEGGADLTDVVRAVSETPGVERVRLSSIELTDLPEGLVSLMAANRRVCRHLHVPLQSGDAGVLSRMNRPYSPAQYAEFVERARTLIPGLAVTTDLMVGFPGETVEEFESSRRFVERMGFSRAHVFRYSSRPGTAAAGLPDDVAPAEKSRRSGVLARLAACRAEEFARGMIGARVGVLAEGRRSDGDLLSGYTDNYTRVEFEAGDELIGEIVEVEIVGVSGCVASGIIVRGDRSTHGG